MPFILAGSTVENPLSHIEAWPRLIEAVGPASLLAIINGRMSTALKQRFCAEDMLQESLAHAWRDRAKFQWQGLRSFRAWLLSIIDHRIRDTVDHESAQKRGGGRQALSLDRTNLDSSSSEAIPPELAASTTPSRLAMFKEQAGAMERAMMALPDEFRDVVRLRLWEQREMKEIAEMLGIGVEAVRHRFRKGAAIYREQLLAELTSQREQQ